MAEDKKADKSPATIPDIETNEGRREILRLAAEGDQTVTELVNKLLDRDQEKDGWLIEAYGDTFEHASMELTKIAAGKNIAIRECLQRKIQGVRDEVAGPRPTPPGADSFRERERALCWFDANEMDRRFVDQTDISFKTAEYRESRRDRAHKRFLAACSTLAKVREFWLGLPSVQINQCGRPPASQRRGPDLTEGPLIGRIAS